MNYAYGFISKGFDTKDRITELSSNKEFTLYQSIYGLNYKCALYSWDIRKY